MADNEALAAALAALEALPIVNPGTAKPLGTARDGIIARLTCPPSCTRNRRTEQLQLSAANDTLPKCAASLLELLKTKHASCIAEAQAAAESAAAAAAHKAQQGFLGTMMDAAVKRAADERRAKELKELESIHVNLPCALNRGWL